MVCLHLVSFLFTELFAPGIVYYCNIPHQSADNPLKMSYKIKQIIQLRLSEIYPIILQVRRPFDNTASSCPGSLPLGIIYFYVVFEQLGIVVVQNIRTRFITIGHCLSLRPLLESFLSHLGKQVF